MQVEVHTEGGTIQFLVEECESNSSTYAKYRFLVCDNGMGMSADFKDTIFDVFTRAEGSLTNKIQGTGLGMAITKIWLSRWAEQLKWKVNRGREVVLKLL